MSKVIETVEGIAIPILETLQLELVDLEYVKEGKNWFLRVFVDKDGGVDIEECGVVSERLSESLDESDPIPHPYFLEVSSPGAERPLKKQEDFEKAVGKIIHIKTYEPIENEKVLEGKLLAFDGDTLSIEIRVKAKTKTVNVPYDKVAKARLAVSFS